MKPFREPDDKRCPLCGEQLPTLDDNHHRRAGFSQEHIDKPPYDVIRSLWRCMVRKPEC